MHQISNICGQMVSCWFMVLILYLPLLDICDFYSNMFGFTMREEASHPFNTWQGMMKSLDHFSKVTTDKFFCKGNSLLRLMREIKPSFTNCCFCSGKLLLHKIRLFNKWKQVLQDIYRMIFLHSLNGSLGRFLVSKQHFSLHKRYSLGYAILPLVKNLTLIHKSWNTTNTLKFKKNLKFWK